MKHAATLLVRNITRLYTMEQDEKGRDIILSDAFLAVYHDDIITVGEGSGASFIDKDTRILNAMNAIVVPGFIDVCLQPMPLLSPLLFSQTISQLAYYEQRPQELIRDMNALLYLLMKHGITTFAYPSMPLLYEQSLLKLKQHWHEWYQKELSFDDVISCTYDPITFPCIDPLVQARSIYHNTAAGELDILKKMTVLPARKLDCSHLGTIKKGQQADFLILEGPSFAYVLHQLSQNCLRNVVKKGNVQMPFPII